MKILRAYPELSCDREPQFIVVNSHQALKVYIIVYFSSIFEKEFDADTIYTLYVYVHHFDFNNNK